MQKLMHREMRSFYVTTGIGSRQVGKSAEVRGFLVVGGGGVNIITNKIM